jgi:hypothetical protein
MNKMLLNKTDKDQDEYSNTITNRSPISIPIKNLPIILITAEVIWINKFIYLIISFASKNRLFNNPF